jgi:hypothetical protein
MQRSRGVEKAKPSGRITFRVTKPDGTVRKQWEEGAVGKFLRKLTGLDMQGWPCFGRWVESVTVHNLITNAGLALIAGRLNGSGSPAAATFIAVGTGTTAAAAGDTALQTEIVDSGLARAAATVSLVTTDVTNDTARMTNTFSVTGTKAVTEAGVLNAGSGGTLLNRQVFSAVNVVNLDSLAVTVNIDMDTV